MRVADVFEKNPLLKFSPTETQMLPNLGIGIEIEVEGWDGDPAIYLKDKRVSGSWIHHRDDSLRNNGAEFTIGPICGQALLRALKCFENNAKERRFQASARTAIHVHMDCTAEKDLDFVRRFTSVYMLVEPLLYEYVGQWRRYCGFCTSFFDGTDGYKDVVNLLRQDDRQQILRYSRELGRYAGLNLASLVKFGTLEARILPTVFDYTAWVHWINTLMCIYAFADKIADSEKLQATEQYFARIFSFPGVWKTLAPYFNASAAKIASARANLLLRAKENTREKKGTKEAKLPLADFDILNVDKEKILGQMLSNPILRKFVALNGVEPGALTKPMKKGTAKPADVWVNFAEDPGLIDAPVPAQRVFIRRQF